MGNVRFLCRDDLGRFGFADGETGAGESSTFGALTIRVQGLETLMGRGEARRIVRPAADDLDVAR
jgi:hypothetical protein